MTTQDAIALAAVLWAAAILAAYHTCHGSMTRLGHPATTPETKEKPVDDRE